MRRVVDAFKARLGIYVDRSERRLHEVRVPFYLSLPAPALRATVTRAFDAALADFEAGGVTHIVTLLGTLGRERSQQGIPVMDVLTGLNIGFQAVSDDFADIFADDLDARFAWESARNRISYAGATALAGEYLAAREATVRAQAEELAELSLRVLPLYPGILVLPLVGRISAERADKITHVLLTAIARHRCRFALLDLSGVAAFDAEVAGHIVRAAQATRLLGATPILVGLSPAAAQALVGFGDDGGVALGPLLTLADLESGLRHALAHLGVAWTANRELH